MTDLNNPNPYNNYRHYPKDTSDPHGFDRPLKMETTFDVLEVLATIIFCFVVASVGVFKAFYAQPHGWMNNSIALITWAAAAIILYIIWRFVPSARWMIQVGATLSLLGWVLYATTH